MRLKRQKCEFKLPTVSYLGHVISTEGLRTGEVKMEALMGAPEPRNLSELRSFIGIVNYYGKFLPDLATNLTPLYKLLRQTSRWKWGPAQREAFQVVKAQLKS